MSYVNSNTQQTSEVTKAAETHSTEELVTMLRQLKLSAMADCLAECIHCQRFQESGFNDQLYELVVCEKIKDTIPPMRDVRKMQHFFPVRPKRL